MTSIHALGLHRAAGADLPHFTRRLLQLSQALERPPTPTMCKLHTKIDNVMNARCEKMTSHPEDGSCATLCMPLIRKRGHLWRPLTRDRCRYITINLIYFLVLETTILAATTSRPQSTDTSSHEESIESCWLPNPARGRCRDNLNENVNSSSFKKNH